MPTQNYNFDLLCINQAMKEFTINHTFNKIDYIINRVVISFIDILPQSSKPGEMYIIKNAKEHLSHHENKIAIYIDNEWQFLSPTSPIIIYVLKLKAFYLFDGLIWTKA